MNIQKILIITSIVLIGLLSVGLFFISADFSNKIDTSKCDNMSILGSTNESLKIGCYGRLAVEKQNIKICDKIKEIYDIKELEKQYSNTSGFNKSLFENSINYFSDSCKAQTLYLSNNTDIKQCNKILNNNWKSMCYYGVAVQLSDSSLCKNVNRAGPESDVSSDECIYSIAVKQKNIDLCKNINEYLEFYNQNELPLEEILQAKQFRINNCYSNYALATNDSQICSLINGSKDNCYYNIAVYTKNHIICDLMIGSGKDDCYNYMAGELDDFSYCAKIPKNATISITCFTSYAVRKKDKKICDNIEPIKIPDNIIASLFTGGDPLIYRKQCYNSVDRANGIVVNTPSNSGVIGSPIM